MNIIHLYCKDTLYLEDFLLITDRSGTKVYVKWSSFESCFIICLMYLFGASLGLYCGDLITANWIGIMGTYFSYTNNFPSSTNLSGLDNHLHTIASMSPIPWKSKRNLTNGCDLYKLFKSSNLNCSFRERFNFERNFLWPRIEACVLQQYWRQGIRDKQDRAYSLGS